MAERLATQKYAMSVSEQGNPTAWDKQLCTVKKAVSLGCGVIGEKLIDNRIVPESALYKNDKGDDTKYDGSVNFAYYSVSNKTYTPGIVLCRTKTFSATNCYGKAIGDYNISTGTSYVACQIGVNMGMVVYIFVSPNTNDYTAANFSFAEAYTVTKLNISHTVSLGGKG